VTVKELMERVGMTETGRALAYIKDGLEEMSITAETHVITARIDINEAQRYYNLPNDVVKVLDIRCKHHNNTKGKYQSIPRSVHPPPTEDEDGI